MRRAFQLGDAALHGVSRKRGDHVDIIIIVANRHCLLLRHAQIFQEPAQPLGLAPPGGGHVHTVPVAQRMDVRAIAVVEHLTVRFGFLVLFKQQAELIEIGQFVIIRRHTGTGLLVILMPRYVQTIPLFSLKHAEIQYRQRQCIGGNLRQKAAVLPFFRQNGIILIHLHRPGRGQQVIILSPILLQHVNRTLWFAPGQNTEHISRLAPALHGAQILRRNPFPGPEGPVKITGDHPYH